MKTNQRLLSAFLALVMIITMIPFGLVAYAADEDTISISNAAELVAFATNFNDKKVAKEITTVKLTDDIDMSGITDWKPIGNSNTKFNLVFDGQNHVIKNLSVGVKTDNEIETSGIFGYVSGTVQNLAVADSKFVVTSRAGAIAANASGTIKNCAVYRTDIIIDINYKDVDLNNKLHIDVAGGIVGVLSGGTVTDSYSKANVYTSDDYGMNFVGGVVAYAEDNSKVSNCYYAGNMASINGVYNVAGGIAGRSYKVTIENCYVAGLVTGEISGAVVGWTEDDTTLTNNYYYEDSNICESQNGESDGLVTTKGNQVASAADLTPDKLNADAFEETTGRTDGYAFPSLKNNLFDDTDVDAPDEDKTNFAGGRGTLYAPYLIETKDQLANIRNNLNAAYLLKNDIDMSGVTNWKPIGTETKPFCGMFDGGSDNYTIRGLVIESTGKNAAMFIYNFGVIKNFTLTEKEAVAYQAAYTDPESGDEVPEVPAQDAIPSSITLNTKTDYANAAAIAVYNFGRIENVTSDVNVTLTSNQLSANAAGIVAINYGVVDSCKNAGNIFVDNTAVINDAEPNYKNVFENVSINVAGLVAINNATGTVSGSSSDTARSLLTSAPNTNGIAQSQFVALNNAGTIGTMSDASFKYGSFIFTMTAETAHNSTGKAYSSEDNAINLDDCKATLNGADIAVKPTVDYSKIVDNYQKITVTYTKDTKDYQAIFLAWLDYTNITVNHENVKKSYLLGDKLSTGGLVVQGQTAEGNSVELKEVKNDIDNGYRVTIYDNYGKAGQAVVTDLSTVSLAENETDHKYTVVISYYGKVCASYEITVYGIKSISVVPTSTTYLEGTTPEFKVTALYGDPSNTTKKITKKNYTYTIDTDKQASAVTGYVSPADIEAETATAPTFPDDGTYYIYVKVGNSYGKSDGITVIGKDAKVSNLTATVGTKDVDCDNVKLDWTYENAGKEGVTFKIQRIESFDMDAIEKLLSGEALEAAIELAKSVAWKTLKSGVTETTYTDTKSETGTKYQYRVVVVVAGESCPEEDATTISGVEPATPENFYVKTTPSGDNKFYTLGESIKHTGLEVVAEYPNGSTENITYSDEQTKDILKYYLDTSDFNSNKSGEYTIKVMHAYKYLSILTRYKEIGDYKVQVLDPSSIEKVNAEYTIYPKNYSKSDFKSTLTAYLEYLNPESKEVLKNKKVDDSSVLELPDYDASVPEEGYVTREITVNHPNCPNDYKGYKLSVTFVEPIAPTNVEATANADGTVSLEWDKVPGAKLYNIYRSTSEGGSYELVAERKSTAKVTIDPTNSRETGKDKSDTLDAGKTYYYKVCGVIAGQETDKSKASNAVTTAKPEYYMVDVKNAKDAFAVGDKFRARGVKVYAVYNIDGEYDTISLSSSKYSATCSGGLDEEGRFTTAGTYNVTISITNAGSPTIKYVNGDTDTGMSYYTIKAYDMAAIDAEVKKDAYPLNYEFSKSDVRLRAIYGENIGDEENEVIAKKKTIKSTDEDYVMTGVPDTTTVGTKNVVVTYGGYTATGKVNVYDPDATVIVKGKQNDDYTASLVITASSVPFVKSYTIVRSTSPDMDENVVTKKITEKSSNVVPLQELQEYMLTYTDTSTALNKEAYYYTITPTFLDGTEGNSSTFVQVDKVDIVASEIEAVAAKGVTRSSNNLLVTPTSINVITVSEFVDNYIETENRDETCIKVFDGKGNLVEDFTKPIGTGYVIALYTNSSCKILEDKVTVVIYGDASGDGCVDVSDIKKCKNHVLSETPILTGVYFIAANVTAIKSSDSEIDVSDIKKIINFALESKSTF